MLLVLGVARLLGVRAVAAGLLPVAVGYLIAHYLTFLLFDGQRIIAALNDPLLRGDNLLPFDLGFWEPTCFIPVSIVWSIQLAAVVGGHIVGAWAGHAAWSEEAAPDARRSWSSCRWLADGRPDIDDAVVARPGGDRRPAGDGRPALDRDHPSGS